VGVNPRVNTESLEEDFVEMVVWEVAATVAGSSKACGLGIAIWLQGPVLFGVSLWGGFLEVFREFVGFLLSG